MTRKLFLLAFAFALSLTSQSFAQGKLRVICSLFPGYDFAKNILSDRADVKLLLRPGVEPHDFEPSARDIMNLNESDIFIYTGDLMEPWAAKIVSSLNPRVKIINLCENIALENSDPHIWLDLEKSELMIRNILEKLRKFYPDDSEFFTRNANSCIAKLHELDRKLFALKARFDSKTLVFGGHFSFAYLLRRYGFKYITAYESENEPSIRQVARVIKFINDNRCKYFLCDKFGVTAISHSISEQTGAEILTLDSMHNITQQEFDQNITFAQIFENNVNTIQKFLEN